MAKKKRPLARRPRPGQGAATAKKPHNVPTQAPAVSESGLHEVTEATAETAGGDEAPPSGSETGEEAARDEGSKETDVGLSDDGVVLDEEPIGDDVDRDQASAITSDAITSDEVEPREQDAAHSELATSGDVEEDDVPSSDPAHSLVDPDEQEDDVYTGPSLVQDGPLPDEADIEDIEGYLKGLVEAIIFSSDRPQTAKDVARAARLDRGRVQELIDQLVQETQDRGVRLVAVADGYAFRTHPNYSSYVRDFLAQRPVRLSRAQLETLAIIAYRQPLTRPEVDDIRGVDSGAVIKLLLERELIRVLGKKDEPGRPMIYGTTHQFLELFSLGSLRDLPTLREFTELNDDSRAKFELEVGEPAPEGPIDMAQYDSMPGSPDEGENQALEEGVAVETIDADSSEAENRDDSFSQSDEAEGDLGSGDDDEPSSEPENEGEEEDAESLEEEDESTSSDDYVAPAVSPEDEEEFPDDEDDDEDDEDEDEDDEDDEDDD